MQGQYRPLKCLIELICSRVQKSPENEVKEMYDSCIIELFCLTDSFCAKKKVNTMHGKCLIELICSLVEESPKNEVKAMHSSCMIELPSPTVPFYAKKAIPCIMSA